MRIHISDAATTLPEGKPQSDDMRHMIEHFHTLGLIRRIPGAFKIGDAMYVHPTIAAELRRRRPSSPLVPWGLTSSWDWRL